MDKKWRLPLAYIGLVIISMLPPYTQVPYDPRNTQEVIGSILRISIQPYQAWGWLFHIATLLLVLFVWWEPVKAGRALAGYIGVNYLIIAALQTHANTEKFGIAVQTGALVGILAVGFAWLVVMIQNSLELTLSHIPRWCFILLPLALLAFWSPVKADGVSVSANFDPRLLLTSADFGLTYCFVTPVFLFLLILFSTNLSSFAFRITAFNALLYGLFNLAHWFNPNTIWMGVMHLPLLILASVALLQSYLMRRKPVIPALAPS